MHRRSPHGPAVLVLAAAAALSGACSGGRAADQTLLVRVLVDPALAASCLALDASSLSGEQLASLRLERRAGQDEYRVAVLRRDLPAELGFSAKALVGKACESPLFANGSAEPRTATFVAGATPEVVLHLNAPDPADDLDADGYLAAAAGGPDCADQDPGTHPGAPEDCLGGADLNCNSRVGCDDPACAGLPCSGAPAALAFLTDPLTLPAASCSPAVSVQSRDATGLPAKVRSATPVSLDAASPGELRFYSDPQCTTELSALTLAPHTGEAAFHFRGSLPGAAVLTASSPGLTSASQQQTLTEPLPAAIAFLSGAQTVKANLCSEPVTVQARDGLGQPVTLDAGTPLALTAAPASGFTFYDDPGCASTATTVTVQAGSSTANFRFKGTAAGAVQVTVSGLGSAAQTQTITPGDAEALTFVTPPQTLAAGSCSNPVVLQSSDLFGNPAPLASAMLVSLSASPDAGFTFFSDGSCAQAASSLSFGAGYDQATFRFSATRGGDVQITAAAAGFSSATQQETVTLPWPADYTRRRAISMATGPSTPVNGYAGYTLTTTFDSAQEISAGELRADGNDLRILYWTGSAWAELDRLVIGLDTSSTTVLFRSGVDPAANTTNTDHYLYYGAPDAGAAPADPNGVFLFFDDFEAGTLAKWTVSSGAWQVATDRARSGTHALKYPNEAWSGNKWLSANSTVDEADVMFDAWWNLSSVPGANTAQFVRQQPGAALSEYETNLSGTSGWDLAYMWNNSWGEYSNNRGTPAANSWTRIGLAIRGTKMRVFQDGAQITPNTGTAEVGGTFASGNVGFRKWDLSALGQAWWLDDVTVRRYTDPEPTATVSATEESR